MKIDRLLSITIFLLNHPKTTSKELANKFEVSVRTIKRDIENINLAGIPVMSTLGSNGGYSIHPRFTLDKQFLRSEDFALIAAALTGLQSSFENKKTEEILEKYQVLSKNKDIREGHIYLNYSAAREGKFVQQHLSSLEKAIIHHQVVDILYCDAKQQPTKRQVHPLALRYQWYDWYLFGYDPDKKDYRMFKIVRIKKITIHNCIFKEHHNISDMMLNHDREYSQKCIDIDIHFHEENQSIVEEYFPKGRILKKKGKTHQLRLHLPENEMMWKAKLIALGDCIKIIKPDSCRQELMNIAQNFIKNNNQDSRKSGLS
ncbi:WYL domain-containing protein [Bacillaceae bacterium Marseille-Q3522]|nr:WYL domain-containing protein [Bacillaceae bacterium Marseille-Q3522]